jgi:hypothetical protein
MSEDSYSEKRLINSPFYKDANELRFEISVLNRQLEVAREWLSLALRENEFNEFLAEIECIGKENGTIVTNGEEDGKV